MKEQGTNAMSRAVTEHDQDARADGFRLPREAAPSIVRADEPTLARWIGLVGLMLVTLGSVALVATVANFASRINPVLGSFFFITGLACLLFHAFRDAEVQVRRIYGFVGYLWLAAGILVTALPIKGPPGTQFLPYGFCCFALALLFLMPFVRNETVETWRRATLLSLAGVGAVLALTGFIGGNISENFLIPYSLLLTLLGLAYLWGFMGLSRTSSDAGYRAGLAVGTLGILVFLIALGRTALPPLFYSWHWLRVRPEPYLIPSGLLLMVLGLLFAGLAYGLTSDNKLAVLTRRELAAFFYSPIAYIVLFGLTFVGWWVFIQFVNILLPPPGAMMQDRVIAEPIIRYYFIAWWPVITTIFVVPVLTMRLLSEEQRTGTLEVLFTAPVGETVVVLSKFLASWIFFLLAWVPWGLFLVALRVEGGQPFEYRPLLSFYIAMACSGAAFLAMGLFFSSLTRNQIASAILTFVGMLSLTAPFFVKRSIEAQSPTSPWIPVLERAGYIDLWITSMDGRFAPQHLLFQLSFAIFWLFVTVRVLESRKWR
jgi:ABC-type transport system involved in multi-copper enzyme maturation permease subunit